MGFLVVLGIFPDQVLYDVKVNVDDSCSLSSKTTLPTVCKSAVIKVLQRIYFFQLENSV